MKIKNGALAYVATILSKRFYAALKIHLLGIEVGFTSGTYVGCVGEVTDLMLTEEEGLRFRVAAVAGSGSGFLLDGDGHKWWPAGSLVFPRDAMTADIGPTELFMVPGAKYSQEELSLWLEISPDSSVRQIKYEKGILP